MTSSINGGRADLEHRVSADNLLASRPFMSNLVIADQDWRHG